MGDWWGEWGAEVKLVHILPRCSVIKLYEA